eukprot:g2638.t1
MATSQQPEGAESARESMDTDELVPLEQPAFQIINKTHKKNPKTGRQEPYYTIRFLDPSNDEELYSEKELRSCPEGIEALEKYFASSSSGSRLQIQSPASGSKPLQPSILQEVQRASEVRDQERARTQQSNTSRQLSPQTNVPHHFSSPRNTSQWHANPQTTSPQTVSHVDVLPVTPEPEERETERPLDNLKWSNNYYTGLSDMPEWMVSLVDMADTTSTESDKELMVGELSPVAEEQIDVAAGPSIGTSPIGKVISIELTGKMLIQLQDGSTAWVTIPENTPLSLTSSKSSINIVKP